MKIGIRQKLIVSFFATLILPLFAALTVGINTQSASAAWGAVQITLALIIPFAICALILGRIISVSILKPLHELSSATKHIMNGHFDFTLSCKTNDEMGDLCAAFDVMREQLKLSLEKQAALERSRKQLIASISHDLRTPMSSIKGYVEGLQDGIIQDEEKFHRYISVIKNKTESLDRLIESLFHYSQLDIIDFQEANIVCDSREWLESIVHPIEMEFSDQPAQLIVVRPFPSVRLSVHENSMAQVFDNLISNARRYAGPEGTITIEAAIEGEYLNVSVTDNGTGISEDDLPYVFDQFYRAEKSRSRNYGGAGLGLAICKKIVENHGGKIWAESKLNVMTKFSFTLPIVK
jgi:signal transduction histidine kinase